MSIDLTQYLATDHLCEYCGDSMVRYKYHSEERGLRRCIKDECHRERRLQYMKDYGQRNREKLREYMKKYHIRYTYGLTDEEALHLFEQGCGICKITENLVIDHCHETDVVRGALCYSCNSFIGQAKEDETILLAAIEYLRRHNVDQ